MRTKITKKQLEHEIEKVFPILEMPSYNELFFHSNDCRKCDSFISELEENRGMPVTNDLLRTIHQELSLLSAKAWCWIFPYYLRFAITEEAKDSEMEVQYFIYNLSPDEQFNHDTLRRLAEFNEVQIECLIIFFEWCLSQSHWKEPYGKSLKKAIIFLNECKKVI